MAISNLQETLLMYAKEKSRLNLQFNDIQFNLASATKKTLAAQQQYNNKMSNYYYMYKDKAEVDDWKVVNSQVDLPQNTGE